MMEDSNTLDRLKTIYGDYLTNVTAFFQTGTLSRTLNNWFSGSGRYSGCPLHQEFLTQIEAFLSETVSNLEHGTIPRPLAGALLDWRLFCWEADEQHPAYWTLNAAEGLAIPLVPFVEPNALLKTALQYEKRFKGRKGLPNQKKLLKEMQTQARAQ